MKYILWLIFFSLLSVTAGAQTVIPFDSQKPEIDFMIESDQADVLYGDVHFIVESREAVGRPLIVFVYSIDSVLIRQIPLSSVDGGYRWQGHMQTTALAKGNYFFRLGVIGEGVRPIIWHAGFSREVLPLAVPGGNSKKTFVPIPSGPIVTKPLELSTTTATSSEQQIEPNSVPLPDVLWQSLIATSSDMSQSPASADLSLWCRQININSPEQCSALEQKFMPAECQSSAIPTMDSCEQYLRTLYIPAICSDDQTIPRSCSEMLSAELLSLIDCGQTGQRLCQQLFEEKLGQLARRQKVAEAMASVPRLSTSDSELVTWYQTQGISWSWPLVANNQSDIFRLYTIVPPASIQSDGQVVVWPPFVLSPDADGDELIDDLESRYGSDPRLADTDGDSYPDGHEVNNGYSPVATSTDSVASTPWDRLVLTAGALTLQTPDEGAEIGATISSIQSFPNGLGVKFSGQSETLAAIGLLLSSADSSFLLSAQADAGGTWEYFWSHPLSDGVYEVRPLWLMDDHRIAYGPSQTFFMHAGAVVSVDEFLNVRPHVAGVSIIMAPWSILGQFAIGLISIAIGYWLWRQHRPKKSFSF